MNDEIEDIIIDFKIGSISVDDAVQRILNLFAVSNSVCSCGSQNYGYGFAKCYDCGKIKDVLEKVENLQKTDTIKTTFDLRTCFLNMQNDKGVVILDKTQWEEICKLVEK
jgi:hypothetical protein